MVGVSVVVPTVVVEVDATELFDITRVAVRVVLLF